jgi:hypothetical protein
MKKDIIELKVEDIAIAIVPNNQPNEEGNFWSVYIINLKETPIQSVFIVSKGYGGNEQGQRLSTTTLRYFYDFINPKELQLVEPIEDKVFGLTNEYWISFSMNGHLYDKKYIFVVGSLDEKNFTLVPILNQMGVMIK